MMLAAIGSVPVGVSALMSPDFRSILVESSLFKFGVTIVLPLKLIQCAWGCAGFWRGYCV